MARVEYGIAPFSFAQVHHFQLHAKSFPIGLGVAFTAYLDGRRLHARRPAWQYAVFVPNGSKPRRKSYSPSQTLISGYNFSIICRTSSLLFPSFF